MDFDDLCNIPGVVPEEDEEDEEEEESGAGSKKSKSKNKKRKGSNHWLLHKLFVKKYENLGDGE